MYESLNAHHFRSFKEFSIEGLTALNLITGDNNAGKTCLLETLFLASGPHNVELSMKVNRFRGIDRFDADPIDIWGWLFHDRGVDLPITITGSDTVRGEFELTFSLQPTKSAPIGESDDAETSNRVDASAMATGEAPKKLHACYKDDLGNSIDVSAMIGIKGPEMTIGHMDIKQLPSGVFLSTRHRNMSEDAKRFSKLAEVKKEALVVDSLRTLFPELVDIEVLSSRGTSPMLYVDIGLSRLIPSPLLGDGFIRLASILLAIHTCPGGVVLIDEVENGIYFDRMEQAWVAIAHAAETASTQVFCTAHSNDCVVSFAKVALKHSMFGGGFSLHRLDRENGEPVATTLDKGQIGTFLQRGWEMR